jgi:pyruvate/2-oxoglutarate dehydrogenase complex dihydrolipoamide acyltransferase (E2) component
MTVHVHSVLRVIGLAMALALLLIPDYVEAQYGGARRRTRRRTAVIVSSATHEQDQAAAEAQADEEADAKEEDAAKEEAAAPAPAPAPPAPETGGQPLPIGTVASKLPDGCESVAVDGVTYYHDSGNYYRAVFQEDTLVYVTVEPPK